MDYKAVRPRRLRRGTKIREFFSDVSLSKKDLIMPIFVRNGEKYTNQIASMPSVVQMSPDVATQYIERLSGKGVDKFILFGVLDSKEKDANGEVSLTDVNPVVKTLRKVREAKCDALMIADVCLCEYATHGHCGILSSDEKETTQNDPSAELLAKQSVVFAKNGADIVAPSAMIDNMILKIRSGLDEAKLNNTLIMCYTVKFASAFYGPFRDIAGSAPQFVDRKSYQMDFRRVKEWKTEAELDLAQGADMLLVKPGMPYLDILSKVASTTNVPVGSYQVSGEYAMLNAAAEKGMLDLKATALESLYSFKRAGANFIITYFAEKCGDWL